jgi:hypothetical protein
MARSGRSPRRSLTLTTDALPPSLHEGMPKPAVLPIPLVDRTTPPGLQEFANLLAATVSEEGVEHHHPPNPRMTIDRECVLRLVPAVVEAFGADRSTSNPSPSTHHPVGMLNDIPIGHGQTELE